MLQFKVIGTRGASSFIQVFNSFSEANAKAKWLTDQGFETILKQVKG